jgi:hypothetical protein
MAHFAKLDTNNTVLSVHVVNNEVIKDSNGVEQEQLGVEFLTQLHGHSLWKQTSYNGSIRKNYAGINYTYDTTRNAFIPPKPYASWLLNEDTCNWYAPVTMPTDDKLYKWDEASLNWIEVIL